MVNYIFQEENLQRYKEEGGPEYNKNALKLYDLQKSNYDCLMSYINRYQPDPFSKAWGNDPDYLELCRSLAAKSTSGEGVKQGKRRKKKRSDKRE